MIQENLKRIMATIPEGVTLLAVSKTKPECDIMEAYEFGVRDFGENKVQEMTRKHEALPKDIRWHLIGHLQTNKVKYIASYVHLVHSVDSLKLLQEINKEAQKCNRVISCLLQFHTASEETKFGLLQDEAVQILESESYKQMQNVQICGVMGMATNTDSADLIHQEFKHLKSIFDFLKTNYFSDNQNFKTISMGMSQDYPIAIEEGSTIVRVGSSIFGERDYSKQS